MQVQLSQSCVCQLERIPQRYSSTNESDTPEVAFISFVNAHSFNAEAMEEENGHTGPSWSKGAMKEAVSELLQEMPLFNKLVAETSSQPAAAVPSPLNEPKGGRASSQSSECEWGNA